MYISVGGGYITTTHARPLRLFCKYCFCACAFTNVIALITLGYILQRQGVDTIWIPYRK